MAKVLSDSAKKYLPQTQAVKTLLAQNPVDCAQLVLVLDSLANAPRYPEMNAALQSHKGTGGVEGQLWNIQDAYADAVNQFRIDTFRSVRNACASGAQPTTAQLQGARDWMNRDINPVKQLEEVIRRLQPVVGP